MKGLTRLKKRFVISTLSNGNMALLTNMAKHAGLPWDCVLSAELFRHYKPDREVYLGAARLLGLRPGEVMMVAAHKSDLDGAKKALTEKVAKPLGLDPIEAAEGILRIATTKMAHVVRWVTTERGLDARDFPMVAFGGAGPLHATLVAPTTD